MKYFTLFIFSFSCILVCVDAQAQSSWNWGISLSAGMNGQSERSFESYYGNQGAKSSDFLFEQKRQPAFGGGFWVGKNWGQHFEITQGLTYWQKRAFHKSETTRYALLGQISFFQTKNTTVWQQIRMPFKINYIFGETNKWFRPFVGVGISPSYTFGISKFLVLLNIPAGTTPIYSSTKTKNNWSDKFLDISRWNFPLEIHAGVRLGKIQISITYSREEVKRNPDLRVYEFIEFETPNPPNFDQYLYWKLSGAKSKTIGSASLHLQYAF